MLLLLLCPLSTQKNREKRHEIIMNRMKYIHNNDFFKFAHWTMQLVTASYSFIVRLVTSDINNTIVVTSDRCLFLQFLSTDARMYCNIYCTAHCGLKNCFLLSVFVSVCVCVCCAKAKILKCCTFIHNKSVSFVVSMAQKKIWTLTFQDEHNFEMNTIFFMLNIMTTIC